MKANLYTACVTPFVGDDFRVDYVSLERLLRAQEAAQNGVLLLGSTGEGLSLHDFEKRQIMTFICNLQLKTEIMVGVPSYNLDIALEWLDFCNDLPLNGYLITTPIYTKPGIIGQTKWFEKLLNKSAHSAMLYNIPGRSGVSLHPDVVQNLKKHEKFYAIKDSSGILDNIVDFKIAAPNVAVYCGDDYMMPAMAAEGAVGMVSVASNAWPDATKRYVNCCLSGKKIQSKVWWQASRALLSASNPIPIKALLKELGIIESDMVRLPLDSKDLPSHQVLLACHRDISDWSVDDE